MFRTIPAVALSAALVVTGAAYAQNINGERTDQQKGESGYLQQNQTNGLGQTGISRKGDIRRTATGKLDFTPAQVTAIREAAAKVKLSKQDSVGFTIAVGAAVPQQAGARALPQSVAKAVPTTTPLNYVLAGDQLILVDRRTARIVAIVPDVS